MIRQDKIKKLRNHVDIAAEREMRQIEKKEHRERRPGEKETLRKKNWEQSADRIHKNKLHEVFKG